VPWCPRCDETFPQGPACPRCSARLVAREHQPVDDPLHAVPGLRSIKVSRRYLRALERLNGPRASGSRALALALVLLVFASGFLLGRVGSLSPAGPTVSSLPAADPLVVEEVNDDVISYVTTARDPLVSIVEHDVYDGQVLPLAEFSPPIDRDERVTISVVALGRSVAAVVSSKEQSYLALAPHDDAPQAWVSAIEAAWSTENELLVRKVDGSLEKWTFGGDRGVRVHPAGDADELLQTSSGAVVRRGQVLESAARPRVDNIELPDGERAIAIAPDVSRALLRGKVPVLWDGRTKVRMRNGSGDALGAAFDPASERVAIVLRGPDGLVLAIVDRDGNAQLKPLGSGDGCESAPVWDASGEWVYVGDDRGTVHVVEASGARVRSIKTHAVGCGVAWLDAA
jgi:hypothetical protein